MTPRETYLEILNALPPGLEREIVSVLVRGGHIGEGRAIHRRALLNKLFPDSPLPPNLANFGPDRQMRLALVALQAAKYAVLSSSGKGGYYLAESREEVELFIAHEITNRVNELEAKAHALRAAMLRLPLKWEWRARTEKPRQESLWR